MSEGVEIDELANITLEIRPPRSSTISDSVQIKVIDFPEETGTGPGQETTPNINPQFIDHTHPYWKDREWTFQTVAEVETGEDSVEVFVSVENDKLDKLIKRAQRHSMEAVESIKDFYLEHISYHALISDLDRQKKHENKHDEEENNGDEGVDLHEELKHACDTISGIIDSIYNVLVIGDPSSESSTPPSKESEDVGEKVSG